MRIVFILGLLGLCTGAVHAQDHPLVSSYPGAAIAKREVKAFDTYELITGPWGAKTPPPTVHLEGKLTAIDYLYPRGRSTLEVTRNYESALKKAGFQIVFSCLQKECGSGIQKPWGLSILQAALPFGEMRYVAAKLPRAEGDVYVALHVKQTGKGKADHHAYLVVLETKPMQQGMVSVDAAALAHDISTSGHIAVYGVYFDTAKWDIKPESEQALTEIAKLLTNDAKLELHVVGHTDSAGTPAANLELSKKRAAAVVSALTQKGIAANRLDSQGVGQYAPVTTNRTAEGRAKNRRVELVER